MVFVATRGTAVVVDKQHGAIRRRAHWTGDSTMQHSPSFHVGLPIVITKGAFVFAILLALALVASCSTTEGMGKDVKNLGKNIEDSADRNK
jgi:predicted small secreted protein